MIELQTERLFLRTPHDSDAFLMAEFEKVNRDFWQPYISSCEEMTTERFWRQRLQGFALEFATGRSIRLLLFLKGRSEKVIGIVNFTQICREPFHACYLGYKIDRDFEGQGLMHEALAQAIGYLFDEENMHRIMANYMPANQRSAQLLERLKFQREGFAMKYLLINGAWEDHVLTALTNRNWQFNPDGKIA